MKNIDEEMMKKFFIHGDRLCVNDQRQMREPESMNTTKARKVTPKPQEAFREKCLHGETDGDDSYAHV